MEHEVDRPAEPEKGASQEGTPPVGRSTEDTIKQTDPRAEPTNGPAGQKNKPTDPDLLPLPPAPLPREVQADREREELAQELLERRFLRRRHQKEEKLPQDDAGKARDKAIDRGKAADGGPPPPAFQPPPPTPTPLPSEPLTPVSPAEEAEMSALVEALFKEKPPAKKEEAGTRPPMQGKPPKDTSEAAEKTSAPGEEETPSPAEAPRETADDPRYKAAPGKRLAKREGPPPAHKKKPEKRREPEAQDEEQRAPNEETETKDFLRHLLQEWSVPEEDTPEEDLTQTGKLKVRAVWNRLLEQTDEYAKIMYEEETETEEPSPDWAQAHLKRDVYDQESRFRPEEPEDRDETENDEEKKRRLPKFLRRFQRNEAPEDGLPEEEHTPEEMTRFYKKQLGRQRLRAVLVGAAALALCYIALAQRYLWPFPGDAVAGMTGHIGASLVLTCVAALLGWDVIKDGIAGLFRVKATAELLAAASVIASILDAGTLLIFQTRTVTMPFCAVSVCSLLFALWGRYSKGRSRRMSYRVASLSDPYLVTRDSEKWEGGKCFTKHLGSIRGFVTQVEAPDGIERVYQHLAPLLLLASLLFGLIVSVGKSETGLFLWSFSAMAAAAASFSSFFAYSMPYAKITRRLMNSGATLAGWPGASATGGRKGIALGDRELFPAGTVEISGLSVFGVHTEDTVIAYTASVMRESGCGLDKIFHELLRRQGMILRRVEELNQYESGGFSAAIRGQSVLIGSAAFMREAKVRLAPGQHVKHAVFCAIGGELAGIFALRYRGASNVKAALFQLLRSRLSPVMATRDFNITDEMLSRRFKLKQDVLAYPPLEERLALSDPKQDYEFPLVGLLVRDGLAPFAETVVGARRLSRSVMMGGVFAIFNSVIGVLMAFYLTYAKAFDSISVLHLLVFMLMWLVPAVLIGRGVNRY
ncbi:MAG: hypothetical protein ACOX0U_05565 [Oscillospiraceae bacterium]|jgi:hypothetical protein